MRDKRGSPIKSVMQRCLVYGLLDPRTGELRYVGKSTSGMCRPNAHRHPYGRKGSTYKDKWLRELYRATGQRPCIIILKECSSNTEAIAQEIIMIAMMKACGYRLTNLTDGGDGVTGYKPSEEARIKIGLASKGRTPSPETRRKIGNAHRGRKRPEETLERMRVAHLGKKRSPECIEKIRRANTGRKHTEIAREHMRKSHVGQTMGDKNKENLRKANVGRKLSLEHREKLRLAHLGKKRSQEANEKIRKAQIGRKRSPETIEKTRQANLGRKATATARANMSRAQQKRWHKNG